MPPKNIAELKPWDTVQVYLLGPYIKSIRQQKLGRTVICNNSSLTYMMIIEPATGWFKTVEIPTFDFGEVELRNDEYINKPSARVIQLFNNIWICRYPRTHKVVFDNSYYFKQEFINLLKDFYIKPVLTSVKNTQTNAPLE